MNSKKKTREKWTKFRIKYNFNKSTSIYTYIFIYTTHHITYQFNECWYMCYGLCVRMDMSGWTMKSYVFTLAIQQSLKVWPLRNSAHSPRRINCTWNCDGQILCKKNVCRIYILQWTQASATFLKWLFGNEFTWFCAVHIWLFRENEKDSQTNYKPHNISECVRYLRQNSVNSDFYVHLVICFAQQSKTPAKFSIQSHTRTVSNWRNNDSCSNLETKSWNLKCP